MYQEIREMIPPPSKNTVAVCNQITLLILYYISSRLVTCFKLLMLLYKSLIFFILMLFSSSSILAFRYSFFLFLKYLLASRLTMFQLPTLFSLDPVATALYPASFDLKIVNIFCQTMVYAENCAHVSYYATSSGNSLRYHYLLRNNIEKCSSYVHRGGSLISLMVYAASVHVDLESL
jgi:hypothetical protein